VKRFEFASQSDVSEARSIVGVIGVGVRSIIGGVGMGSITDKVGVGWTISVSRRRGIAGGPSAIVAVCVSDVDDGSVGYVVTTSHICGRCCISEGGSVGLSSTFVFPCEDNVSLSFVLSGWAFLFWVSLLQFNDLDC